MNFVSNLTREVKLNDGKSVTVKELSWPTMFQFMQLLTRHIGGMTRPNGDLAINVNSVVALVAGADELCQFMLINSTGNDAIWLESIGFSDGLAVLDAALELNLNDQVMGRGKNVAVRVQNLLLTKNTQSQN